MSFKAEGENIVINIPDYDESAEVQKQLNEKERNENEEKRIAAENTRKSNENSRIAAENTRVKEHEEMKKEINKISNEVKNINLIPGPNGKSSYEIALEKGFVGTVEEYLESLKGRDGQDGPQGPQGEPGQEGEKGEPGVNGKDGTNGQDGHTPEKGIDYFTEEEKTEMVNEVVSKVNEDIGLILDEINGEVV